MDIIIGMLIAFSTLVISVFNGIFVGYPLFFCFSIFVFISWRREFPLRDIAQMSIVGGKKAFVVLEIFVLIGIITSIWMASGTVPAIIYYGMKYMNPNLFILYVFLISCGVSFLIGTSLGTVGTVGIALIFMAKGGNVDPNITAGAIIAGAFFGDRCSPMASSANLIANLTQTNLYTNIVNMFKTGIVPFVLSLLFYFLLSLQQPMDFVENTMDREIISIFEINWVILLPAFIILLFSLFKINIKLSMMVSIVVAVIIAKGYQGYSILQLLRFIFLGFNLETNSSLDDILKGGGIISMWGATFVVFISCCLSGIFNGTNMLKSIQNILRTAKTRYMLFVYTTITSIATAAFGCNQSISTVLTHDLMGKSYEERGVDNNQFAADLGNTGVLLAALIPWSIAAFVPTTTMNVSPIGFIPYAFYLYIVPIVNIIYFKFREMKDAKETHRGI